MIRISISRDVKRRNKGEWRFQPTATAEGIKIASDDALMPRLCQRLIEAGHDPEELCEAYRGDMPVFLPRTLRQWAERKAMNTQEQPEHLRRAV